MTRAQEMGTDAQKPKYLIQNLFFLS